MSGQLSSIEIAGESEKRAVVDTLVQAFGSDPFSRWLFPTAHEYSRWFPELVDRYAGSAFETETAYRLRDFEGSALWLPPGEHPDEEGLVDLSRTVLSEEKHEELGEAFGRLERDFPDEPCWYLAFIGVDPGHQGRGYGSTLLEHTLAQCDRTNDPATLVSSNPRNLSIYLRHGFELLDPVQVGSVPPLFPMVRYPDP